MSACAETDSILKQLAKKVDPNSHATSINAYHEVVSGRLPYFKTFEARIPRYRLTLRPWDSWSQHQPPHWWQDHNKVKHHRHENFERANLKNCLNAVAALYCVTLHFYADEAEAGDLYSAPKLFITGSEYAGGSFVHDSGINLVYRNLRG